MDELVGKLESPEIYEGIIHELHRTEFDFVRLNYINITEPVVRYGIMQAFDLSLRRQCS